MRSCVSKKSCQQTALFAFTSLRISLSLGIRFLSSDFPFLSPSTLSLSLSPASSFTDSTYLALLRDMKEGGGCRCVVFRRCMISSGAEPPWRVKESVGKRYNTKRLLVDADCVDANESVCRRIRSLDPGAFPSYTQSSSSLLLIHFPPSMCPYQDFGLFDIAKPPLSGIL
jgi:hypothetical protein